MLLDTSMILNDGSNKPEITMAELRAAEQELNEILVEYVWLRAHESFRSILPELSATEVSADDQDSKLMTKPTSYAELVNQWEQLKQSCLVLYTSS